MRKVGEAARSRDLSRITELYTEDAVAISPAFGQVHGRAAIGEVWQRQFTTFDDYALKVATVLIDGDRAVILGKASATDRKGWYGLPATGGQIEYQVAMLLTIVDGKISRDERIFDNTGVLAQLEKARFDGEMKTAAELQHALLSRTAYQNAFCDTAGDSVPCRAIGGDFFEFVPLSSGALGIAIGDIAGKGPAAALIASLFQGMFSAEVASGLGPAAILARLNRSLLERHLAERFATIVYAEIFPGGELVYSNAGHSAPFLVGQGGVRRLSTGGRILGAFADATFEEETIPLRDGDTLVMFTDGVIEACNERDEEFGEGRLLKILQSCPSASPAALVSQVLGGVREFGGHAEQNDDATVTVTRFSEAGSEKR